MSILYSIVSFTIVLGIIVLVHEYGHYIACRLTGVRVETFSFGFGKRLFGKKVGDTDFRFSLIPLGGYVKMAGEEEYDPNDLKPYEFHAKNRAQKIFILAAGAFMNVLLAFLIFTVINITGVRVEAYKKEPPQIGYVMKGSPAEAAGIRKGDVIRTVDGRSIKNWGELEMNIGANPDSDIMVEFERDGKRLERKIDVKSITSYKVGHAGFSWGYKTLVTSVSKDSPAARAGLEPNDVILEINNEPVNVIELSDRISGSANREVLLRIKRGEQEREVRVTPREVYFLQSRPYDSVIEARVKLTNLRKMLPNLEFGFDPGAVTYRIKSRDLDTREEAQKYLSAMELECPTEIRDRGIVGVGLGMYSPTITTRYGVFAALKKSVVDIENLTFLLFNTIKKMIVGKLSPKNLSGPIEIATFSRKAMESGMSNFFMLIAFISLQLGIINLFPIPALDGGHLLIYSIEAVTRREFSQKVKNILMNIGFAILIVLMGFVILNDIAKKLPNGWNSLWPF